MRRGKFYHYLHPTALAPDMPRFGGLPRFARFGIRLSIGGFQTEFTSEPDQNFVEIIPGTWETRYHGTAQSGIVTVDFTWKIFPSPDREGIHCLCGGIQSDGSSFLVEKWCRLDNPNEGGFGAVYIFPPFENVHVDGSITGVIHCLLFAVPYNQEP